MSLRLAINGLIVLVAVLFGTMTSAVAHVGHSRALSPAAVTVHATPSVSIPQAIAERSGAIVKTSEPRALDVTEVGVSAQTNPSHLGGTGCLPGACGCQGGESSCGMSGHCCSSLPPQSGWTHDLSIQLRYQLAGSDFNTPDIVTGLDRPPKA